MQEKKKLAIEVDNVQKIYKLYDKPSDRMKEAFGFGKKKKHKLHYALKGVDMKIYQGETVGIIGTNGSGKSTILKIITGVLNPTSGRVLVNGRISALLELGAGFNMEYNGIENVYLNGTMMGFSEKEIEAKLPEILSFADIGDYVYQPVKTYSRKVDTRVLNILAGIAASAHKMSNDIRLLQHLKEVEEPFEKSQIGSSAMAYKRNPMRSERIASLSRYVMIDALNPAITSATQWFERTLDDSANKRLSVPEGFLAIDGILDLCLNVVDGLVVYPKVIEKRLMSELPFMATENIMMDAVKAGGDRQELHERIRELSMEAGKNVKVEGKDNNLLELIAADPAFNLTLEDLQKSMDPSRYTGRAKEQTEAFIANVVQPVLDAHKDLLGVKVEINV